MPKIKQLSLHEAHKIAAGEVIERPANIVKELIENALDAQATHISLYIEQAGTQLIRIVDNGCGMDEEDALACFTKHATSKITTVDELETINTFGFRGEALASLAAVAGVTLITKQHDALMGVKVMVSASAITSTEPVSAITGTDISVHDLFYTVPARKKFLKKNETEWRHIVQLFHAFCLAFTSVHFKLYRDNMLIHNCSPVDTVAGRFAQLWHNHTLLPITNERLDGTLSIVGTLSDYHHYRYDRSMLFFFVNNRWVKNVALAQALLKGYQGLLPEGRYPTACIMITIDSTLVDINIHPRKEEVAFMYPQKVTQLITASVKKAFEQKTSKDIMAIPSDFTKSMPAYTSRSPVYTALDFQEKIYDSQEVWSLPIPTHTKIDTNFSVPTISPLPSSALSSSPVLAPSSVVPSPLSLLAPSSLIALPEIVQHTISTSPDAFTIIGQFNNTYILIAQEEGLYLVDQHAAHERILYERFKTKFNDGDAIQLLFPQIISLSLQDYNAIFSHVALFTKNGIGLEPFGENQFVIKTTPTYLKEVNLEEVVHQVVGWIHELGVVDEAEFFKIINEKLHAQLACKAAIKAGDSLTDQQMRSLLADLHKTANRFTCPHGRPTGFLISLHEIEKKFKRKT